MDSVSGCGRIHLNRSNIQRSKVKFLHCVQKLIRGISETLIYHVQIGHIKLLFIKIGSG